MSKYKIMNRGREAFMRSMEHNQFYKPDWPKLLECLDSIAGLREKCERLSKVIEELKGPLADCREALDMHDCKCVLCKWQGWANPIDLCPECHACIEIRG